MLRNTNRRRKRNEIFFVKVKEELASSLVRTQKERNSLSMLFMFPLNSFVRPTTKLLFSFLAGSFTFSVSELGKERERNILCTRENSFFRLCIAEGEREREKEIEKEKGGEREKEKE